jgi:hypothetical protein
MDKLGELFLESLSYNVLGEHSREKFSGELRFPMWISEYYHESIYSD